MVRSLSLAAPSHAVLIALLNTEAFCQSIPGATLFAGGGAPGGTYQLIDDYEPSVFFNKFNFYNSYDPTYGHVQYVNGDVATRNGYVTTNQDNVVISVDTTNKWPNGGLGRPSVRIISDNTYTHGLFILDLAHMPAGCGTWPAFWLLGPEWPSHGEIDIIEGVNTQTNNGMSMHTDAGCTITGTGASGTFQTPNCDQAANDNSGCGFSANGTTTPNNYGAGLNSVGGGVYATEWTSQYVQIWFFPRGAIPSSIASGTPDVTQFGIPIALFRGCDIDAHFGNHSIIINTDFCGAYAGNTYSQYSDCPLTYGANGYDSCVDFVGNNPQAMTEAYWRINSIKVYQMPPKPTSSMSSSSEMSTTTPASTASNTINQGMGQSTSSMPTSLSYSGPLSSATSSSPSAQPTPAICPSYNTNTYTNTLGNDYLVYCGYDYSAEVLSSNQTLSFEACLDVCDSLAGCTGVSYVGGNGAGTCNTKAEQGSLVYDGLSNAAVRSEGAATGLASYSTALATTAIPSSSATVSSSLNGYAPLPMTETSSSTGLSMSSETPILDGYGGISTSAGQSTSSDSAILSGYEDMSTSTGQSSSSDVATLDGHGDMSTATILSATSTTVSASVTPSASFMAGALGSCPSANDTVMMDENEIQYAIYCRMETTTNSFTRQEVDGTFTACFDVCDVTPGCVAFTFVGNQSGFCYLKDNIGNFVAAPEDNFVVGVKVKSTASSYSVANSAYSATQIPSQLAPSDSMSSPPQSASPSEAIISSTLMGYHADASSSNIGTSSLPSAALTSSSQILPGYSQPASITKSTSSSLQAYQPLMSSSAPTTSTSVSPLCGTTFKDPGGTTYEVHCSTDNSAGSFQANFIDRGGFTSCFGVCSTTRNCLGFTFSGSDAGYCYLKSSVGTYFPAVSTIVSCFKVSGSSSPAINAATSSSGVGPAYSQPMSIGAASSGSSPNAAPSTPAAYSPDGSYGAYSSSLPAAYSQSDAPGAYSSPPPAVYSQGGAYGAYSSSPPVMGGGTTYVPECTASTSSICGQSSSASQCSSAQGSVYSVGCGYAYVGDIIDTSGISGKRDLFIARATEPSYQACIDLCDRYPNCVGLNYQGTNCELLSSISGTTPSDGNVGATYVQPAASASSHAVAPSTLYAYPAGPAYGYTSSRPSIQTFPTTNGGYVLPSSVLASTSPSNGQASSLAANSQVTVTTSLPPSAIVTVNITTTQTTSTTGVNPSDTSTSVTSSSGYLCFTCFLTPTVITGAPTSSSNAATKFLQGTCSARRSIGTTTVFTTKTITDCPTPLTCPAPKTTFPSGSDNGSEGGASGGGGRGSVIVETTTDSSGRTVTITSTATSSRNSVPAGSVTDYPSGGYGGYGGSTNGGSGNSGGAGGLAGGNGPVASGNHTAPMCPGSDAVTFTDSMGMLYSVACGTYINSNTVSTCNTSSLASCIDACDQYNINYFLASSQCLAVSYFPSLMAANCELKGGTSRATQSGCDSGVLLTPSRGANNETTGSGGSVMSSSPGSGYGSMTLSGPGGYGGATSIIFGTSTTVVNGQTSFVTYPASTVYETATSVIYGTSTTVANGQTSLVTYPASTIYGTATSVAYGTSTTVVNGQTSLVTYPASTVYGNGPGGYGGGSIVYGTSTQVVIGQTSFVAYPASTVYGNGPGGYGGGSIVYGTSTQVVNGQTVYSNHPASTVYGYAGGGGGGGGSGGSGAATTVVYGTSTQVVNGQTAYVTYPASTVYGYGGGDGGYGGGGGGGGATSVIYATSTKVVNGQTSYVTYPASTVYGPGGGGGYGNGGVGGGGIQGTTAMVVNGQTVYSTYGVVPMTVYGTATAVSTYVSNGQTVMSTYGYQTVVSVRYLPASTNTVTTTTVSVSLSVSVSVSVSNGVTVSYIYGTTTAAGPTQTVSGATQTATVSLSGATQTVAGPTQTIAGPTQTAPGATQTVSVSGGGSGPGYGYGGGGNQTVTVTQGGSTVTNTVTETHISYIVSSSSSKTSSFYCRTTPTNYIKATPAFYGYGYGQYAYGSYGTPGGKKKRSIFDIEVPAGDEAAKPQAMWRPKPFAVLGG